MLRTSNISKLVKYQGKINDHQSIQIMFFEELIPLIILASVPMVGVIGWTLVKMTEHIFGRNKLSNRDIERLLNQLEKSEAETSQLKNRLENIEVILTTIDDNEAVDDLLNSYQFEKNKHDRGKVEQFAQSLKDSRSSLQKELDKNIHNPKEEAAQNNFKGSVGKLLNKIDLFLDEQELKKRIK